MKHIEAAHGKRGVYHWITQRITAVLLIPLSLWFVTAFIVYVTSPYEQAKLWVSSPLNSSILLLSTLAFFYHGYLGLQVVLEDYVPNESTRRLFIFLAKLFSFFMAALAVICIALILLS